MKITNKKIAAKKSSVAWLQRQAADPYVARAQKDGYRARAAYKIIEMNEKFKFLRNGQVVVDLGAAPGSWSQYIARTYPKSRIFAMDLLLKHIRVILHQMRHCAGWKKNWDCSLMKSGQGLQTLLCLIWHLTQWDIKRQIIFARWYCWNTHLILRCVR